MMSHRLTHVRHLPISTDAQSTCTRRSGCPHAAPSTPTATSSSRPTSGRRTSSRSTATGLCAWSATTTGSKRSRSAGKPSAMSRRGLPVDPRRDGRPRPARHAARSRTHVSAAKRRSGAWIPNERLKLLDAEGIDAAILYTTIGLLWEAELEDPELSQAYTRAYNRWICEFCAGERPPRADRAPLARRSGGRPRASSNARSAKARAARTSRPSRTTRARSATRQRPGVRRRAGPRRAVRHPPDVRAAVDEGRAHGHVGEREAAAAARVGDRVRRRAPAVHDAVRLRRVRQVPAAEGRRARVGRRVDRLLARSHRRDLRPHVHRDARAARAQAERLLPRALLDLVRSRRAHHPRARRALRRPVHVGVGLPARRPHARVHRRPRRARRRVPRTPPSPVPRRQRPRPLRITARERHVRPRRLSGLAAS